MAHRLTYFLKIQQWWLWSVMSFLFDKIEIQVLGLFILTSASVTFKNFEKQKRSILDDVFWNHKTFLWAGYKKERESNWDPIENHRKDNPTKGNNYPKDSSLLRKLSLCIECSLSSNWGINMEQVRQQYFPTLNEILNFQAIWATLKSFPHIICTK